MHNSRTTAKHATARQSHHSAILTRSRLNASNLASSNRCVCVGGSCNAARVSNNNNVGNFVSGPTGINGNLDLGIAACFNRGCDGTKRNRSGFRSTLKHASTSDHNLGANLTRVWRHSIKHGFVQVFKRIFFRNNSARVGRYHNRASAGIAAVNHNRNRVSSNISNAFCIHSVDGEAYNISAATKQTASADHNVGAVLTLGRRHVGDVTFSGVRPSIGKCDRSTRGRRKHNVTSAFIALCCNNNYLCITFSNDGGFNVSKRDCLDVVATGSERLAFDHNLGPNLTYSWRDRLNSTFWVVAPAVVQLDPRTRVRHKHNITWTNHIQAKLIACALLAVQHARSAYVGILVVEC